MINNHTYRLPLVPMFVWFIFASANSALYAQEPQPVDLVVILSAGCEEILAVDHVTHEPCCNELFAACKDDQIVVVSPSILYGILRRKRNGQDGISECLDRIMSHYNSYLNSTEDFVVLVPTHNLRGLKELGFQDSQLTRLEPEALMQFSHTKWEGHLIEIEHFRMLFKAAEYGYEMPAKNIYLISHGIDALDEIKDFKWSMPLVASLTVWQFVNFLHMLNSINTQFLHIASCYAAGLNFFNIERILSGVVEDERCTNAQMPINFPIMIQGTTDSPVSAIIGNGSGCKRFFSVIRQWLDHDKDNQCLSEGLSRALYTLNTISLGPNYPVLKISQACPMTGFPVQGASIINADAPIFSVDPQERYLYFYPADLHNTTLRFESLNNLPHCISKVMGRACHFLGAIQAPGLHERTGVTSLLYQCFLKEVIRNYDQKYGFGVSDKAWFIKRILSGPSEDCVVAKGVVVQKGMLKYGLHKALILYQDAQGAFRRIRQSLPVSQTAVYDEIITEHEYIQTAARIFWETRAGNQALEYATCGKEQCWHSQESFSDFFSYLGLSVPAIDVRVLVQEDIAQVRNRTLKKEAYLNYISHVHDEDVLRVLVDECAHAHGVVDYDDIATVLTHFVDTENQNTSLQMACALMAKDKDEARQAAVDVLIYMVNAGLYVHASRACQDVLTCFDALACKPVLDSTQMSLELSIRDYFALLIQTTLKGGRVDLADPIMSELIKNDRWARYGLGLEVCTQLVKQQVWDLVMQPQPKLQWFAEQLNKHLTEEALALYFEQKHIIEEYQNAVCA